MGRFDILGKYCNGRGSRVSSVIIVIWIRVVSQYFRVLKEE
jgi:hypothetical protein